MSEIELKQRLHELHDELERASKLTTEERDVLGHLMTEMVEIAQAEEVPDAPDDLQDRVERYAGDFENQHPRIAGLLRHILDVLGKMGI